MKSRKLRALALALSAIMTITAVPSTLFAEDFFVGAAEEDGWDSEVVADVEAPAVEDEFDLGFGSEVVEEEVVEAPEVADFDFFAADEMVAANDGIALEEWDSAKKQVKITYLGGATATVPAEIVTSAENCTLAYMVATVEYNDGTGVKNLQIQSNIKREWPVKVDTKSIEKEVVNPTTGAANINLLTTDVQTAKDYGFIESGKTHEWNDGARVDEEWTCTKGTYWLKYTCKNCKVTTFDTSAPNVAKNNNQMITVKGEGHKKPATVETKYYVTGDSLPFTATDDANYNYVLPDGTTLSAAADLKNSVLGADKKPTAIDSKDDATWVIETKYVCEVCGHNITELTQDSSVVRRIAYAIKKVGGNVSEIPVSEGANSTSLSSLTGNTKNYPDVDYTVYEGTAGKDWSADKAHFVITDCYANNGVGKYTEVWYTGEWADAKIVYTVEHEVKAHEKTKTIFKTTAVPTGKNTAAVTGDDAAIAKKCKVEYAADNTTVKKVVSSITCQPTTYYEVVVCDCANSDQSHYVVSCEKKTAEGNEKGHKLNPEATAILNLTVPSNGEYDLADLTKAAGTKGTVTFKNATYKCGVAGTVDIYYTCDLCKKEALLGTYKVAAPEHQWAWVDIDPKEAATCTKDGYVTQQSQCTVCKAINPNEKIRTATVPKLNHEGVKDVKAFGISVKNGGDIVGLYKVGDKPEVKAATTDGTSLKFMDAASSVATSYDNEPVIGARLFKICPICGEPVYVDPTVANPTASDESWGKKGDIKYAVTALTEKTFRCNNGSIEFTASYVNADNTTVSAVGTYDYWKSLNAYQARTNHTAVQKADGSVVCAVCGVVLSEAPVVTTEPTTETTTEAKPETTTVAPQAETTTVAPQPETTTVAPQPETTTVAPQPETTTVAPQPETTTAEPVSETTTEAPATMPAQVTGEKITKNSPTKGIIGVKYNAVEGADSYTVNVREPNGTWTKNPTDGAETAYEITGLTRGKLYDIRIAAVAAGIAGPRSAHLYRWLEKVTLDKPTKIKGEAGAVNVTWTAADGASKYKLYYSTDKAFKTDVKSVKVTENTAKVTGLKTGTRYYFKVRCYSKGADDKTYTGGWSNVRSKILK